MLEASDADGLNLCREILDGVIDSKSGRYQATRAVDIKSNIAFGIFRFKKKKLGNHHIRDVVINGGPKEDDPVFEQP